MSRQYRSFDPRGEDQHRNEVYAVHWLASGPTLTGSLDGQVKIWTNDADGAYAGVVKDESPHRCVKSISSSSKTGAIVTSDILGKIAVWDVEKGNVDEEGQEEMGDGMLAPRAARVSLKLRASRSITERGQHNADTSSRQKRPRGTTCYATQIHPREPLLAATGALAGVNLYACPEVGAAEGGGKAFGDHLRWFDDSPSSSSSPLSNTPKALKNIETFGQSLRFDSAGQKIAIGTERGNITIYDVETGATLESIANHPWITRAVEFTQTESGNGLLVGCDDYSVTLYDLRTPWSNSSQQGGGAGGSRLIKSSYVGTLKGHTFWITDVKASSDGRHAATSSADGHIKLWDLRNRNIVWQTKEEKPVWSLSWGANGSSSFVSGSGAVEKGLGASGNVRWYHMSGTAT